jgi:hypothetical protein
VFERILKRIREEVRLREYVVTHHARKEMREDGFTIYDVERGIFSGDILERQKDHQTGEWKCGSIASEERHLTIAKSKF